MNLYDINKELEALETLIEEQGGEVSEELEAHLEKIEGERSEKIFNLVCWIKNMEAEQTMLEAEEKKLKERRKRIERKHARIEQYLLTVMHDKERAGHFMISKRKSEAVQIEDEKQLPVQYMRHKEVVEPNKALIKQAIKEGAEVPGAKLVTNTSLQVK